MPSFQALHLQLEFSCLASKTHGVRFEKNCKIAYSCIHQPIFFIFNSRTLLSPFEPCFVFTKRKSQRCSRFLLKHFIVSEKPKKKERKCLTNYIHSQLKLIQGTLMIKLEYLSSHLKIFC